ncbi:hypothetical protein As57867_010399, partial [Aphanomyces stellatus]
MLASVWPVEALPSAASTRPLLLERVGGFIYVVATALGTLVYLAILSPSIANDFWWPSFNATGVQTFLGDVYNAKLATGANGTLDLFSAVVGKDYSQGASFVSMRPATARAILLNRLPLRQAITLIRSSSFIDNINTNPTPCWLDLNQTYEMAHTAIHQAICYRRRQANAAVYLETILRNVQTTDLTTSTYYPSIQSGIFAAVQVTPGGWDWSQSILAHTWPSVDDEKVLWTSHGLSYFQNYMQNLFQEGIQDSIVVVNALGMRQSITINSLPYVNRPKAAWTTQYATAGFWNDLFESTYSGTSLIRSAANAFEMMGNDWDIAYDGPGGTPATSIIRSNLGPLVTIDIFYVQTPPTLLDVVSAFHVSLHAAAIHNPHGYVKMQEPVVDAAPFPWVQPGAVYYGGNPLCCYGNPLSIVQASFGYNDDCGVQMQHFITLSKDSVLFAMMATHNIHSTQDLASICGQCSPKMYATCLQALQPAYKVFYDLLGPSLPSLAIQKQLATQDILPLNISFVQWATINGIDQVLTQRMVSTPLSADPWSFFGWMTMYEWVNGQREVYSFEGDFATYTLMTRSHDFQPFSANVQELPRNACTYLWFICVYTSASLVFAMCLVLVYGAMARFQVDVRNLFQCNRIIGGSWIGRPFLCIRGITAIVVLSTSSVSFRSNAGLSKLDFAPRPVWHTCVLAGEATWITYVANDFFLPLTEPYSALYAPISTTLAWLVVLGVDITAPYEATATIGRNCTVVSFMTGVVCASGEVVIGSFDRVCLLVAVVVGSVAVVYPLTRWVVCMCPQLAPRRHAMPSIVLSSTASAFLRPHATDPMHVDAVACVMSGLVPLVGRSKLFDIKNWILFHATPAGQRMTYVLAPAAFTIRPVEVPRRQSLRLDGNSNPNATTHIRSVGCFGLVYMTTAVVMSFLFLSLSRRTLVNDFLWTGFAATNTQSFLSNWFNVHLQLQPSMPAFEINDPRFGLLASTNNVSDNTVLSSGLYATLVQDEANSLQNVVQGLRAMDSCHLPWITTAYCFADFSQRWPMAYSTRRQQRCHAEINNGAVYLEAILRNANWPTFSKCWGTSLEIAIFSAVRGSNAGNAWITSVLSNGLSLDGEVAFWAAQHITRFTTQWQNYKQLGVTEIFVVANALGLAYPLTLKKSNSSFHVSATTSFKMYWSLANDLIQVTANGSALCGKQLIQLSPKYAYANTTLQSIMMQGSTVLTAPLDPALAIFSETVGPFGVVDLKRVAVPASLRQLVASMTGFLMAKLSTSDAIQQAFWAIYTMYKFLPQPQAWDNAILWGGDINCGLNFGGSMTTPLQYFSFHGICGNFLGDFTNVYTQHIVYSLLVSESLLTNPTRWPAVSVRDVTDQAAILTAINITAGFMLLYMPSTELTQFADAAQAVKGMLRDTMQLELIQYLTYDNVHYNLSRVNIYAPSEVDFEFFSWLCLWEWVEGKREVVSFQGDLDTITTLSTIQNFDRRSINPDEIPRNVSLYFLAIIQYISIVLCGVGCAACVYIVASHGYIEGINMMSFSLVAGHVWIGRPLMLIRGLTAISFLSTAKLNLISPRANLVAYFTSPVEFWFMTLLSSGEMAWLVNVIHDSCSMLTREYTAGLFFKSSVLVCGAAAIWSFVQPTAHAVTIDRVCVAVSVDFDVVCTSGIVQIGDFNRFLGLIGIAFGGCFVVYVIERLRLKTPPPKYPWLSFFLYSAAKHKFER